MKPKDTNKELKTCKMYQAQKFNSNKRGHPLPDYSLEEFREWLYSDFVFNLLYDNWINLGKPRRLAPSINRIDSKLPYTSDNIEIITAHENTMKAKFEQVYLDFCSKNERRIIQYTKDMDYINSYKNAREAERMTKISHGNIARVCQGYRKTAGKFIWRYEDAA